MPIWFLVVIAVCACFAGAAVIHALRGNGLRVFGETINKPTVIFAALIIALAWGIAAAAQLGLLGDHVP